MPSLLDFCFVQGKGAGAGFSVEAATGTTGAGAGCSVEAATGTTGAGAGCSVEAATGTTGGVGFVEAAGGSTIDPVRV